jgi:hypothetical protein
MKPRRVAVGLVGAMLLAACSSSSGGSGGDWSRTYFAPREQVLEAAIEVLEREGYLVEVNREKGRISAEPSSRAGRSELVSLEVRVTRKDDRIVVDVQTRSGAASTSLTSRPRESPVQEFLFELDQRLQGG